MGLSTHVLDIARGRPAVGVGLTLEIHHCGEWRLLHTAMTNQDGRCTQLLPENGTLEKAVYRLRFDTGAYYAAHDLEGLYPFVEITFNVANPAEHFHIPLLLTTNGYTTYRGS